MPPKVKQKQRTLTVLTFRQEAFAQHVARGETLAEAHRMAGYNSSPARVYAEASNLAKRPKVADRVTTIRAQALALRQRAETATMIVTAQTISAMLAEAFEDAKRFKQTGSQVAAAMGLAKLHGLLVDKTEDVTRRATRDPTAPLEIDVDHWVTEQVALLAQPESLSPDAELDRRAERGGDLPDAPESPEPLGQSPSAEPLGQSPEGAEPESPEGSEPSGQGSENV